MIPVQPYLAPVVAPAGFGASGGGSIFGPLLKLVLAGGALYAAYKVGQASGGGGSSSGGAYSKGLSRGWAAAQEKLYQHKMPKAGRLLKEFAYEVEEG